MHGADSTGGLPGIHDPVEVIHQPAQTIDAASGLVGGILGTVHGWLHRHVFPLISSPLAAVTYPLLPGLQSTNKGRHFAGPFGAGCCRQTKLRKNSMKKGAAMVRIRPLMMAVGTYS